MLQSTPMLSRQDNADPRACQRATPFPVWTHMGMVETEPIIAAVARAYTASYHLADDVTPAAILGPSRTPVVAQARHLCAYLLAEDYHLTNMATAHALGRADHTTALNSRARIMAALPGDRLLARALDLARADLSGYRRDEEARARRDARRRRALATVSRRDWDEARYWRLQAQRRSAAIW